MIHSTLQPRLFADELAFTDTYRRNIDQPPAIREALCLAVQFPAIFSPIQENDLFAGRINCYPLVGFGMEQASGGPGYYCWEDAVREEMRLHELDQRETAELEEMLAFWQRENTISGKLISRLPDEILRLTSNSIADMFGRLSGAEIDFDKLVRVGLPGLRQEIAAGREHSLRDHRDTI
jgi:hypothetical protein